MRTSRARRTTLGAALLALVVAAPTASLTGGASPPASRAEAQLADSQQAGMQVWMGTTHYHTGVYNNHGLDGSGPREAFRAARNGGFDFLVLTEHSGPTGPANPEAFYARANRDAAAATQDGVFVGLNGFEYSDNGGDGDSDNGHLTVFGTADMVSAASRGMTFPAFASQLIREDRTRQVFAGFNHPPRGGHGASRRSLVTPDRRAVFALSETANLVEYSGKRESRYYNAFLVHLRRGWRVAPTCGLDGHSLYALNIGETSTKKPCRTGILAPRLTRRSVIAAILKRRVYATGDMNLEARYTVNGRWMGAEIPRRKNLTFSISASDPDTGRAGDRITRMDVVSSSGDVVARKKVRSYRASWSPRIKSRGSKYFFVRIYTAERPGHTALLAPVWVRGRG
jgi:hypothetical protein